MKPSARFRVLARDGFRCRYCGAGSHSVELHVDHVHPRSRGGSDDEDNLVTACRTCNLGKSARLLPPPMGISLFDLTRNLGFALEAYHDDWRVGGNKVPQLRAKLRDIGIAIHEFAGLQGLDAAYGILEDEYQDSVVGHLDAQWGGIGQWVY